MEVRDSTNASGETRFALARTRPWWSREAGSGLTLVLSIGAAVYWFVRGWHATSSISLRALDVAAGVIVVTVFAGPLWSTLRALAGPTGSIAIDSGHVVIDSPEWLASPLRVPLEDVRLVSVDESEAKSKFPVGIDGTRRDERSSWLYRRNRSAAVAGLAVNSVDEIPNLAILLERTIEHKGKKDLSTLWARWGQVVDRRIRLVLARVEDAHGASWAFRDLDLVRPVTQEDVDALRPTGEERAAERRSARLQWILLGLIVLVWAGAIAWSLIRA